MNKTSVFSDDLIEYFTSNKRENLYERTLYDYKGRVMRLDQKEIHALLFGLYGVYRHI